MTPPTRRGFVVACTATLAGCGILPEESEPIEASATAPAVLPESSNYSPIVEESRIIETTVTVDFSGDVELTSRQDVIATVFQRVYESASGKRFGLLTAPAVQVVDQPEVVRDPLTAVDSARVVSLAMDADVDTVSEWRESGSATLLGTETTRMAAMATIDGSERDIARVRVRAGEDSVTAIATAPDDTVPPFGAVTRNA
ncbi:DUF6517 family protein [Haloarcula japonica]|uniref:Uncharacterized protein n=1 Tax=Haloarcula japonica (strain ATCC 49778 / DSM 6131 / JCM 7785 / NBRC 101032 / NCIMB 13157 / TR-1) TaxID=1227453 RepID=M0LP17_HALJT|nr:DUF6517 family protein [Haloarcula japonica]EMA34199.1 hypothetical protein C444_01651 [Haloarcula japonica DSM 6131]